MEQITEQTLNEIIKSLAYGVSESDITEAYGVSLIDIDYIKEKHANEVTSKTNDLIEGGWM